MQAVLQFLPTTLSAWPTIWFVDLLRYLIPASVLAGALPLIPAAWKQRRQVQDHAPIRHQRRREFLYSMSTVLIFSMVGATVFLGVQAGWFSVYLAPRERGWGYLVLSLPLLIVLHDAWFYWTHRLLHHGRLFRWTHRTHHRSVAPTPWTAYAFAPTESLVQASFLPAVLMAVPAHPAVIFLFTAHMVVRNVIGHGGIEILPRSWLAGWWGRWFTTTLHHDMHHAHGRCNYGLYFVWWDRWCGTEHPLYRQRLHALIQRISP
jgi:sterol desaturase/sphingolipid hydroxylase (fatty acid hydroxylase superfamily)